MDGRAAGAAAVTSETAPRRVLLLGCGNSRRLLVGPGGPAEVTGLDIDPSCGADILFDLEDLHRGGRLPFDDAAFDEIHAYEVLEHVGRQGDWRGFFAEWTEYHRVLRPGGLLCGSVPWHKSVWAWADPGHTRVIAQETFVFLSQEQYRQQVGRTPMTDYRGVWSGDFDLIWSSDQPDSGMPHPGVCGRWFFVLQRGGVDAAQ